MSRNSIPNQLNASLIREVRMIAQQFFRSKENSTFWENYHGKKKTVVAPTMTWKCARCLAINRARPKDVNDAVTFFEGTAVCEQHL